MMKRDLKAVAEKSQGGGLMELLKCGRCGDRPGLLVTVADRAAGTNINLCYECYKNYVRHVKNGKANRVAVVYDEGVSAR